jgi:hypothetical protein
MVPGAEPADAPVLGEGAPAGKFYLPDGLTADEPPLTTTSADSSSSATDFAHPASHAQGPAYDVVARRLVRSLAQIELTDEPLDQTIDRVRRTFTHWLPYIRMSARNYLLCMPEGLGKTTSHFSELVIEGEEPANGYACFAFRKREQAEEKAREFREGKGWPAVVIRPFREHYERACKEEGETPIGEFEFVEGSLRDMLWRIETEQPSVFHRLVHIQRSIWKEAPSAWTFLFTTHATASTWHYSQVTRLFNHPKFDLLGDGENDVRLLSSFALNQIVWDEIETDEVLTLIPRDLHDFISSQQKKAQDWRYRPRFERLLLFNQVKSQHRDVLRGVDYHKYDELMRSDLSRLTPVTVKFEALPFGWDNTEHGEYKGWDGRMFYIGPRDWLSRSNSRFGFLTTESVMSAIVSGALKNKRPQLLSVDIESIPAIFPVRVPVVFDPRARKKDIAKLAREIVDADPNALVIADMVKSVERVVTYQGAKGVNGLEDRNIYVIPTYLSGEVYARLNVIGQWLGIPNIIEMHYRDQINQAVGRNRGFRQSPSRDTKTTVVCSHRLWKDTVSKLGSSRTLLYQETRPCW